MSRVSYVMMNPGWREAMTRAVREAIGVLIGKVCAEAGVSSDEIIECVFVGNPIMHHLFLGIDPTELGGAPFALAVSDALNFRARDIGLPVNEGARVYTLPCIAGHVGADAAGATLSEGPHRGDEITLLVDVGTNAEIVLGNKERLVAAPPHRSGLRGRRNFRRPARGAGCDRARQDRSGHARAEGQGDRRRSLVRRAGIRRDRRRCRRHRHLWLRHHRGDRRDVLAGIISEDGVIDGGLAARSDRIVATGRTFGYVLCRADPERGMPEIRILQTDVRAIQLAKAALYAGTRLLMDKLGIEQIGRIKLAGAFGSYIDPKYAMVIGLIPDCPLDKVSAGNAAGTGARMALLNKGYRREIEELVRRIEKIETALEPRFQEHFVSAMAFPNKTEPFPNLAAAVALPARRDADAAGSGEPRRRRGRACATRPSEGRCRSGRRSTIGEDAERLTRGI